MPSVAAIALGSNLDTAWGDRAGALREALARMVALGVLCAVSDFFDTAPVGYLHQPRFLNAAVLLETTLEPLALLRALLGIEEAMGRDRAAVVDKGPRVIDLDLLLYDDLVLNTVELTLPHPAMAGRRFVLEPLAGIAPEVRHPVLGLGMAELLARLPAEDS